MKSAPPVVQAHARPRALATRNGRRFLLLGAAATAVGGAAAYRRATEALAAAAHRERSSEAYAADEAELGWGGLDGPSTFTVRTPDGAELSAWETGEGPTVVLPHCWGCSHAIWLPVARRLVESGHRVVLYDQRGHGASTRGTAPLSIEVLAHDLSAVLDAVDARDAVLAGHSMGGMSIMSLAAHRPEVLADRAKALVLVSTTASSPASGPERAAQAGAALVASALTTRAMHSPAHGRRFVRGVFGSSPVGAHMDLTRTLFGNCDPSVRGGFLMAFAALNLLEGLTTIGVPTTVLVGTRDRLTAPRMADQMVAAIPGARLVTLPDRGHMLPLEDPASVTDEIIRAVKG